MLDSAAILPDTEKLFALLVEGHAAQVSVITPNQRLAAALARDFDESRLAAGRRFWEAPDILPLPSFIERLHSDALYSELAQRLPLLLSTAQECAVWETVIASSEAGKRLLAIPPAASLAAEAWHLAHAWGFAGRIIDYPANDDAKAFLEWSRRYERLTERDRHTDTARLPDLITACLNHAALRKPRTLVVYGFDILPPQSKRLLAALGEAGTTVIRAHPPRRVSNACRVEFASAREELDAAARWARARLEAGKHLERTPRIGIVVPDLARSRHAVRRIMADVMAPDRACRNGATAALPVNVSLGESLSDRPLVAAALNVLELAAGEVEFAQASRLIRSRFIAGAQTEMVARARLDAELRKRSGPKIGLDRLWRSIVWLLAADNRHPIAPCPILSRRLSYFAAQATAGGAGRKRAGEWGRVFSGLLERLGFPGERTLDSDEYQALKAWHEVMAGFAALDRVTARMSFGQAYTRLARLAADTLFQPRAADVPIQVLGVLESAGLRFDHLWVTGLSDEAWPLPARANPFLPVALQRAAGVPEASPASSLELDRTLTKGWLAAAEEVVFSHPRREEDRELSHSTLLREIPVVETDQLDLPRYTTLREALHQAAREERFIDVRGPGIVVDSAGVGRSPGGTGVFRDQAACPFRAFARHRLAAEGLESPPAGLDASERGTLVHSLLARIWQELKSQARLQALGERDVDALLAQAADAALRPLSCSRPDALPPRFAALERERLVRLARAWLELEKTRAPFEVALIEEKQSVCFGGLSVNARLDRMDRVKTPQGSTVHVILDYKTGRIGVGDWLGPRPDDPQIPVYAVGGGIDVGAAAFARIKAGEMEFKGIACERGLLPRVETLERQKSAAARAYRSWDQLVAGWREQLDLLGREVLSGEARVDPKRGNEACKHCELQALCRINERTRIPAEALEPEAPASDGAVEENGEP